MPYWIFHFFFHYISFWKKFRFVSFDFVSLRSVSFRFVSFRSVRTLQALIIDDILL